MTEVTVRGARSADVSKIAEMERAIFGGDAWSEDLVREELTGPHRSYLALETEGEIRGYGGVLVVGGDGDVQTIAIDDAIRGHGHGRTLLDALLKEATRLGAVRVFLEVRSDNPIAIGMYERSGFQVIGRRENYYRHDGVDAIIMMLNLRNRREAVL